MTKAFLCTLLLLLGACDRNVQSHIVSKPFKVCVTGAEHVEAILVNGIDGQRGVLRIDKESVNVDIAANLYRRDSISSETLRQVGPNFGFVGEANTGFVNAPQLIYAYRLAPKDNVFVRIAGGSRHVMESVGKKLVRCP